MYAWRGWRGRRPGGRVLALGVVAAVAAGGLAACSAATTPAAAGKCTASPGVGAGRINVGLLYPASGDNQQALAPYRAGVDARLGVANAGGGVNGRKVTYTWADDQGSAETNRAAAQQLVTTGDVFAVQEFSTSPQGSATWLNREGIPVVGSANDPVWSQNNNMFSYINLMGAGSTSISTWGDYAARQGVKKAAVVYSPLSDGPRLLGAKFRTSLESAHIPVAMVEATPPLDVDAVVGRIRATGADFVTGILGGSDFIQVALGVRAKLPTMKILSIAGYDNGIFQVGKALAGMSVFVVYAPFEQPVPAHQKFLDAMRKYAPQQIPPANEIALSAWMDTDLLLRGLQAAGTCPTRQSLLAGLRAIHGYTAGGLLDTPADIGTEASKPTLCYTFLQISAAGNSFVPYGRGPLCGRILD